MNNILLSSTNSGTTWVNSMLLDIGVKHTHTHEALNHYRSDTFTQLKTYYERNPNKFDNFRLAFLYRDPRDVVVSSYFHVTKLTTRRPFYGTMGQYIRGETTGFERFVQFNLYWKQFQHSNKFEFTYEQLLTDTFHTFKSLCEFYEYNFTEDTYLQIIEKFTFENMRKYEIEHRPDKSLYPDDVNARKIRNGKIGDYINHLSPSDIDYCNSILEKYDYFNIMNKE